MADTIVKQSPITIAHPMAVGNAAATPEELLALALKIFAGETLTAFTETSVTVGRVMERTIASGKSAQFPVFGRTSAHYLKAGQSLDDIRENIKQGERVIVIDGLLTADTLIFDLDEFIAHYDFRSPYAAELGNALAISHDSSVLAEGAKLAITTTENVAGSNIVRGTGKAGVVYGGAFPSGESYGINSATGLRIYQILLKIKSEMAKNYVPAQGRTAYVTPDDFSALAACLDLLNSQYGANGTILEANVMRLAGFDIIETPHLGNSGADAANVMQGDGHIFPTALANKHVILVMHQSAVGVLRLKNLAMETGRRIDFQADQIVAKMAVGIGGLRPESAFIGIINEAKPATGAIGNAIELTPATTTP